jgi:hypothetical protein
MRDGSTIRGRLALLGLGIALSALTPARGSSELCVLQSDCDDGKFCTVDVCIVFNCVHTARGCDDFNGCTNDGCSESSNRCVNTVTVDAACEDFNIFTDGDHCNSQGQCVGTFCSRCGGPCETSNDCATMQFCDDGTCREVAAPEDTRTPTRTGTRTRTPTRTRTRTPTRIRTLPPTNTRTSAPTAAASLTPTFTRRVTRTPSAPPTPGGASPTVAPTDALPTPTPSPSPPPGAQCPGDCDDNAAVGINELVLGVSITLNAVEVGACPALDTNGSGAVEITELIAAVRAASLGCG